MDAPQRPAALPEPDLADQLSALSRTLEKEDELQDTLDAVVGAAVGTVPGAEHASISSVRQHREVHTLASSSDLPRQVDQAQYDTGEGPCLDSLYQQRTVRLTDLYAETRWPEFVRRARALGVGSMLAVQLYVDGDELGALNLTSTVADAFSEESEHVALLFAAHAAIAMAGAEKRDNLQHALNNRDVIGQAKGILMERFKITPDEAFRLLVRTSQSGNRKLIDVALELASTGDFVQLTPPRSRLPRPA